MDSVDASDHGAAQALFHADRGTAQPHAHLWSRNLPAPALPGDGEIVGYPARFSETQNARQLQSAQRAMCVHAAGRWHRESGLPLRQKSLCRC